MNPAVVWRGERSSAALVPEPWPSRVDAFVTACAMHAGQRERDLLSALEGLGEATKRIETSIPKQMNPARKA